MSPRAPRVTAWLAARSTTCADREATCAGLSTLSFHELSLERVRASAALPRAEYARALRGERPASAAFARFDAIVREMHLRGSVLREGGVAVPTTTGACS